MKILGKLPASLEQITRKFTVEAFGDDIQPMIEESLSKHDKLKQRKSVLTPLLTVWIILGLALRREVSYKNVLGWLLSGLRSRISGIPRDLVAEGAITHARKRIGVGVLRDLFYASKEKFENLAADFHGLVSIAVDGVTMTMPDTDANFEHFGRPRSGRGNGAFPQTRLVALVATAVHAIFDIAFGPYVGKGTGEPTLAIQLILRNAREGILFLLDKGFYGFELLDAILQNSAHFIAAVPDNVKLKPIPKSRRPDGSYLAWLEGKVEDPAGPWPDGRTRWKKVKRKVRVIEYQIRGFRKRRIATSLLDFSIEAAELVKHYHRRWEIELVYDEVKTHQCSHRKGQCQTVLRSKRPDLVEQEIYAIVALYNLLRHLISQAADKHGLDPLTISFVDSLHAILDAVSVMGSAPAHRLLDLYDQLLDDIAGCVLKRRRRHRAYPRVVKVKMSKFKLKGPQNVGVYRNFDDEMTVFGATG